MRKNESLADLSTFFLSFFLLRPISFFLSLTVGGSSIACCDSRTKGQVSLWGPSFVNSSLLKAKQKVSGRQILIFRFAKDTFVKLLFLCLSKKLSNQYRRGVGLHMPKQE